MWPLRSLYEQTAFSLGRVNKSSPYLAGQQHLWLALQQSNSTLWKAGRYWRTRSLLSLTLCFVGFQSRLVFLAHVLGHIVIYFFIELSRLYWICATFKKLRYGFTGTRFEVW